MERKQTQRDPIAYSHQLPSRPRPKTVSGTRPATANTRAEDRDLNEVGNRSHDIPLVRPSISLGRPIRRIPGQPGQSGRPSSSSNTLVSRPPPPRAGITSANHSSNSIPLRPRGQISTNLRPHMSDPLQSDRPTDLLPLADKHSHHYRFAPRRMDPADLAWLLESDSEEGPSTLDIPPSKKARTATVSRDKRREPLSIPHLVPIPFAFASPISPPPPLVKKERSSPDPLELLEVDAPSSDAGQGSSFYPMISGCNSFDDGFGAARQNWKRRIAKQLRDDQKIIVRMLVRADGLAVDWKVMPPPKPQPQPFPDDGDSIFQSSRLDFLPASNSRSSSPMSVSSDSSLHRPSMDQPLMNVAQEPIAALPVPEGSMRHGQVAPVLPIPASIALVYATSLKDEAYQFLMQYFRFFDRNRGALTEAYHTDALFSYQIMGPGRSEEVEAFASAPSARNLKRDGGVLTTGPKAIIERLKVLADYLHGSHSASAAEDRVGGRFAWEVTALSTTKQDREEKSVEVLLVCHGDLTCRDDPRQAVSFHRSFLLRRNSGLDTMDYWPLHILCDQWTIRKRIEARPWTEEDNLR